MFLTDKIARKPFCVGRLFYPIIIKKILLIILFLRILVNLLFRKNLRKILCLLSKILYDDHVFYPKLRHKI